MRSHCTVRLSSTSHTRVGTLERTKGGRRTSDLSHTVSCRVSRNGKVSYCTINPALKNNATTLVPSSTVMCPCYCGSFRVLSGKPLHFAIGLMFGPLIMGGSSGIMRAHVVRLSGNSRLGGAAISCRCLARTAPMTTKLILRTTGPRKCTCSTTGKCVSCTSPAAGTRTNGNVMCMKTMFPTSMRAAARLFRGPTNSTLKRMLNVSACRPNGSFMCC